MKKIFRYSLYLIVIITVSCSPGKKLSSPAVRVNPLSDTVRLREGTIVYSLPRTVLTVKVELQRVTELPGPYSRYAADLLGLTDVIRQKNEHWTVTGVSVNSHQEADPSKYYVIEASALLRTNALSMKSEGLILDLNPEKAVQGIDFTKGKELNINRFMAYDLGSDEYYISKTDTAFRRVKVDSLFIRIPYTVEKKKKLTEDQMAERAAKRLMDLRDGKILILTGEANVFPQNNSAIDEMNRMIRDYTELFTGKNITEKSSLTFQLIPRKDQSANAFNLFRLSESDGPSSGDSRAGKPVTLVVTPEEKTKDLTLITRGQPDPSGIKTDKLYYRVPDVANIQVKLGEDKLYSARLLVYQLGEIMQLPSNYIIDK